ncbi:MAG: glyoxalase/bleomycin resistance/extradiol dioxygenase family protein [Rhizobiaceae bacterium]|nr:glyoxalase/bleomycin resistance/extradiol dioxygenase family protein [Rhizobiaceae bacterium]
MISGVYVNLPVADVKRSRGFFERLGFAINEQFSGDHAVAVTLGAASAAMLLDKAFFQGFTPRPAAFGHEATEVLVALKLPDRAAVDAMVDAALSAGGTEPRAAQDHGFMYSRAFADLDGHIWEPFWMEAAPRPE